MKSLLVMLPLFIFMMANSQSFAEQNSIIKLNIGSSTGELADYHGMVLKISSNDGSTNKTVNLSSNPYDLSLPIGYDYKIALYAGGVFADVKFINPKSNEQSLQLTVPPPGSVRFDTVWEDGFTPLEGASVSIRSGDGSYRYWTNSTTDQAGSTIRFWLQPTIDKADYYAAEVSLKNGLMYTFSPITINPGKSQDTKIITPWPKVIDQLITVSIYKSDVEKVSGLGTDLTVDLYEGENKIASSKVTDKGDAYFSNLKVGKYQMRLVNHDRGDEQWASLDVTLTGKTDPIRISAKPYDATNSTQLVSNNYDDAAITNTAELKTDLVQKESLPVWIKTVAGWWANDLISDDEFLKAIEYLVNNGSISIQNLSQN